MTFRLAKWITSPKDIPITVTFRHDFTTEKPIARATLLASALGVYVPYLNGRRVGDFILAPGWTSYTHRIQYQRYDVTSLLRAENRLEIGLGGGWAVGDIGFKGDNGDNRFLYAKKPALIVQLEIDYYDGTHQTLSSDEEWEVYTSTILCSEIYHGETVDMTAPIRLLGHAAVAEVKGKLVAQQGEQIKEHERIAPQKIFRTPKGELVIDFGQNMTGYVEVRAKGPRGASIVMHHAEILDRDGNFYTDNMRRAKNENIYVLSGGEDLFKPSYTFQGFRYVRLTEYPFDHVCADDFRAIAVHSSMKRTGTFSSGNAKINQLYHNVIWGQKSNYLDIPTDCPQRDERLGWTGDAQVFCRTAAINFDVERFFAKWLQDMKLEQRADGSISGVIPDAFHGKGIRSSAAWCDAACIIPMEIYLAYGNKSLLRHSFPMMKKWVAYMRSAGPEEFLWLGGTHYGDWLAMDAGEDSYVGATSGDLIASAFYAHSVSLVVRAGKILGEDVRNYEELYENVYRAFRARFMENGHIKEDFLDTAKYGNDLPTIRPVTQTALVLILHFGLCREEERPKLADLLADLVRASGTRLQTGFVGTPYLLHVLSDNGYTDLAYDLLFEEKSPSWLYSVCHGATTMWEHWNGVKEDGSFWSRDMNSFNHYAYGAVYDWIFGVSVGIKPMLSAPAYREVKLEPHPDPRLGFADASIDTRNGKIRTHWYYRGDTVHYEFTVPQNVTAHLTLPSGYQATLTEGNYLFTE